MSRYYLFAFLLCVAPIMAVGAVGEVVAQTPQVVPLDDKILSRAEGTDRKIFMARRLIRGKQFQFASDILEVIYEQTPNNSVVQNLLRTCYDQLKQYSKVELLVRRLIQKHPRALGHRLSLAEVLVRQGKADEAQVAYQEATAIIGDLDVLGYQMLVRSLLNSALEEEALTTIEDQREATGDKYLMALERGSIMEGRRHYQLAAAEYLPVLVHDTTHQRGRAESKLMQLLDFADSAPAVESVLVAFVDSTNLARPMKILTDHYLKSGQYELAFTFALRQDSLGSNRRAPLKNFILQCQNRKLWAEVVRMSEYVRAVEIDSGLDVDIGFKYAAALAEVGREDEAILVYQEILNVVNHPRVIGDALYGKGVIYFEYLGNYSQALLYFDSVVTNYPRGLNYVHSLKSIPHCYLRAGRLDEAAAEFSKLSALKLKEDVIEEAWFYQALISFLQKKYDTAEVALRKLIVDYPRGYFINDALQLVMVIGEAVDDLEFLADYSDALYFEQRRLPDSTRARLHKLAYSERVTLVDLPLYRLAQLELGLADSTAATDAINHLIKKFPESYYLPLGMKIKADMLIKTEAGLEEARTMYKYLLEHYPDYPFASEVREILRRLETDYTIG